MYTLLDTNYNELLTYSIYVNPYITRTYDIGLSKLE